MIWFGLRRLVINLAHRQQILIDCVGATLAAAPLKCRYSARWGHSDTLRGRRKAMPLLSKLC